MANKELITSVGKYIEKYYVPERDDIRMDKEIQSIFQKIFGSIPHFILCARY